MIKLRKLKPAELARRKEINRRKSGPIYLPNIDEILVLDEFVGDTYFSLADFYLLKIEDYIDRRVVDAAIENHENVCDYCSNFEPCPNITSIYEAYGEL